MIKKREKVARKWISAKVRHTMKEIGKLERKMKRREGQRPCVYVREHAYVCR